MTAAPSPGSPGAKGPSRPTAHVIAFPTQQLQPEFPTISQQGDNDVYWSDFPEDIFRRLRQLRGPEWWRAPRKANAWHPHKVCQPETAIAKSGADIVGMAGAMGVRP